MKKIIFISHNASRSGAPLYLLQLIEWLKCNYEVDCTIILNAGGELEKHFEKVGKTYVWDGHFTLSTITEKITAKLGYKNLSATYQQRIINNIKALQPDLVVSNTIVSNKLAFLLKQNINCPFVAIYHEMKFTAQFFYPDYVGNKFIAIFDKIITVNENIKQFITDDYFFNQKNIFVIPPFISVTKKNNTKKNISADKFNILLSGFGGWQKGFDLLGVLLANFKYKNIDHKFSFTWLGEVPENNRKMLTFELDQIGATDLISFPGKVTNMQDYYLNASLFLMLSKEDSFPLTCIEAASYGLPIIAFEKCGGIVEFIEKGAGKCVPFMDINEIVNQILLFESDKDYYNDKSNTAKQLSNEYNISILATKVINVLLSTGINLQKK